MGVMFSLRRFGGIVSEYGGPARLCTLRKSAVVVVVVVVVVGEPGVVTGTGG